MFKLVIMCAFLLASKALAEHHAGQAVSHSDNHHNSDEHHAAVKHINSNLHEHGFHYTFETTNNIKTIAEGDEHGNVHGNFQWISPEGKHVAVNYLANENGYQPKSDVLPTPPPVSESVLKALEYIKNHPHPEQEPDDHRL